MANEARAGESMFQAAEFLNSERWHHAVNESHQRQQETVAALIDETKARARCEALGVGAASDRR